MVPPVLDAEVPAAEPLGDGCGAHVVGEADRAPGERMWSVVHQHSSNPRARLLHVWGGLRRLGASLPGMHTCRTRQQASSPDARPPARYAVMAWSSAATRRANPSPSSMPAAASAMTFIMSPSILIRPPMNACTTAPWTWSTTCALAVA